MRRTLIAIAYLAVAMFPASLYAQGCGSWMTSNYSAYWSVSNGTTPQTANTIYTSSTVDGYASGTCPYGCGCTPAATHQGYVGSSIRRHSDGALMGASSINGSQVCYNCYLSVTNPLDIIGQPGVVYDYSSSNDVNCSKVGSYFAFLVTAQFELATTLEKMSSIQTPPNGTCVTNNGLTECEYGTIPWCTADTSPPDLNPPGVRRVFQATYPTYWKVFALCERPGAGFAWICYPPGGLASAGAQLPDNYPLQSCTKHP